MKYRDILIQDDKPIDDSGTFTQDLTVQEPISEMTVELDLTNGGSDAPDVPVDLAISKIELVDGGKSYWSLSGPEAVAAACVDIGHWPRHSMNETPSEKQRVSIPMRFGRELGDPELAFTPTKLDNPQLKVTWAKNALHLAGSLTLGIWAKVLEDVPAPSKCLMWKDVQAFTSAASGAEDVKLPHDYPYRRLLIRAYKDDTIPESILTHFKLNCDMGKFVPFDLDTKEFSYMGRNFFGPFSHKKMDQCTNGDYHQSWMGGDGFAAGSTEDIGGAFSAWLTGSVSYKSRGTFDASSRCEVLITGYMPHECFFYQFGRPQDMDSWFDPLAFGEEVLWLTQGAASAAVSVAVAQVVPLPIK